MAVLTQRLHRPRDVSMESVQRRIDMLPLSRVGKRQSSRSDLRDDAQETVKRCVLAVQ